MQLRAVLCIRDNRGRPIMPNAVVARATHVHSAARLGRARDASRTALAGLIYPCPSMGHTALSRPPLSPLLRYIQDLISTRFFVYPQRDSPPNRTGSRSRTTFYTRNHPPLSETKGVAPQVPITSLVANNRFLPEAAPNGRERTRRDSGITFQKISQQPLTARCGTHNTHGFRQWSIQSPSVRPIALYSEYM